MADVAVMGPWLEPRRRHPSPEKGSAASPHPPSFRKVQTAMADQSDRARAADSDGRTWLDPRAFRVDVSHFRADAVVTIRGELDVATEPQLQAAIDALDRESIRVLTIDMSGLTFMDSTGIRMLVALDADSRANGVELRLRASHTVRRVLAVSGLSDRLPLVD
jgi:anti-sigma B factor antagonist